MEGIQRADGEELFLFDQTPVLLTPPPGIAEGLDGNRTLQAFLDGYWTTRRTKGAAFAVTGLLAFLTIPGAVVRLGKEQPATTIGETVIPLVLADAAAGSTAEAFYGPMNQGMFDPKSRLVVSTMAIQVAFGTTLGASVEPATLVLRSTGMVNAGGYLGMAGSGLILSGLFGGTIIACAGFRPRPEDLQPAPVQRDCPVTITPRVSGATHNGQNYADFAKPDLNGDGTPDAQFVPDNPPVTPANELGPIKGEYAFPGNVFAIGYFVKTEVDIKVDAPCKIVFVDRKVKTLPGHDLTPAHPQKDDHIVDPAAANAETTIRTHPSVPVATDQHWVVTDGPGTLGPPKANKAYKKEFEVTVTIERADGSRYTRTATYVVELKTDANGEIVKP